MEAKLIYAVGPAFERGEVPEGLNSEALREYVESVKDGRLSVKLDMGSEELKDPVLFILYVQPPAPERGEFIVLLGGVREYGPGGLYGHILLDVQGWLYDVVAEGFPAFFFAEKAREAFPGDPLTVG